MSEADSKVLEATNWRHECTGCDVCLRRQRFAIGLLSISDGFFERIEGGGMREKLVHLIISKHTYTRLPSSILHFFRVNTCSRAEVAKGCM